MILSEKYPTLNFTKNWILNEEVSYKLGMAKALVDTITLSPIEPNLRMKLMEVSLIKGAQATTAIEGNTLSEEEVKEVLDGKSLPPSKEYQQIEVKNILEAFTQIKNELLTDENKSEVLTPDVIKNLHNLVGKNLGTALEGIPGQFRKYNVAVGKYRAPDYEDVPELIAKFCKWLRIEFHYEKGQSFSDSVIQAIVAHVYIEWIHPFSDGNGRTGRLLEFYILMRAGIPDITSHILSNYYNETRPEYYRQIDEGFKKNNLTNFINYALQGYIDGLKNIKDKLTLDQLTTYWQKLIYDTFKDKRYSSRDVFKRRRDLMLSIDIFRKYELKDLGETNTYIAKIYGGLSESTFMRDVQELLNSKLLLKDEDGKYKAASALLFNLLPDRRIVRRKK